MRIQEQPEKEKRSLSLKTVLLIAFVAVLTVFAVKNWGLVRVWPLGDQPLAVVIGISFVLGALIGWLAQSIISGKRLARSRVSNGVDR